MNTEIPLFHNYDYFDALFDWKTEVEFITGKNIESIRLNADPQNYKIMFTYKQIMILIAARPLIKNTTIAVAPYGEKSYIHCKSVDELNDLLSDITSKTIQRIENYEV